MSILLVASTGLFAEGLRHQLEALGEVLEVSPEEASARIPELRPATIVIDDGALTHEQLTSVIEAGRGLPHTRMVLLNLKSNELAVLNAHQKTIHHKEDLLKIIQAEQPEDAADPQEVNPAQDTHTRAQAYGFLATLCNQRPDEHLVQRLRAADLQSSPTPSALSPQNEALDGVRLISQFIQSTRQLSDKHVEELLAVDWTRLFRGVAPGYGPPPPYEGVYARGDDLQTIQAVAHCYREQGVQPIEEGANRPDYLGLELDFLRFACEQQAEAWERGDPDAADHWQQVEQQFLQEHPGKWAHQYCQAALQQAKTDFYRGFCYLIQSVLDERAEGQRSSEMCNG